MSNRLSTRILTIDGRGYEVTPIIHTTDGRFGPDTTHILIPVFLVNNDGINLVETCIKSLLHFSGDSIQIWVVDNNSPKQFSDQLVKRLDSRVNILLNRTEPKNQLIKPNFGYKLRKLWSGQLLAGHDQLLDGAYANGIGLEIGRKFIPEDAETIFTIHSDTCVTHPNWLEFMKSNLVGETVVVGGYHDRVRINAMHVSCLLIDYQWFKATGETFMPNNQQERFPDRPIYDVGDSVSWRVRADGLKEHLLKNTQNFPELADNIISESPFKVSGNFPRVFNDDGEIIFMHFGRGTVKAAGTYDKKKEFKLTDWIVLVSNYLKNSETKF